MNATPNSPAFLTDCRTKRTRRRDLFELAGLYALILVVIWTPRPWQYALWAIAGIAMITIAVLSFDGFRPMGLTHENLSRSFWAVGLAAGISMCAVLVAMRLHTLHMPETPWLFLRRYGAYILWAAIQQIILQWFFLSRSMRLLGNATSAAALAAGMFAVAHLPNPILTAVTLIAGLASCLFFIHYRNLVPLAIAHAILGVSIAITIPGHVDHNMRVGIGYLTYIDRSNLSNQPHRQLGF